MALTTGENLGLLEHGAPGESHYEELMRFFRGIDVLVQPRIISATTAAPPATPADGDAYIVPDAATGAWAGQSGNIARWTDKLASAAWEFITPKKGWSMYENIGIAGVRWEYTGTTWRRMDAVPTYADQTAAATGGLVSGEIFKTSAGVLMVKT